MLQEETEQPLFPPDKSSNKDEKNLLEKYTRLKDCVEVSKQYLSDITGQFEAVEAKLISLLEDDGKSASAKYNGIGHVVVIEGPAWASIEKGRKDDVIQHLKSIGREDMISTTIQAKTLSVFVRQQLKQNMPVPDGVTFYKEKSLRFYQEK